MPISSSAGPTSTLQPDPPASVPIARIEDHTPTIAVVGVLENCDRHAVSHFPEAGLCVVLFGESREELGGSEWLALRRGLEAGLPPSVDLDAERRLHELLRSGVARGLVSSAHDIPDGGLAVAAAEWNARPTS